MLHTRNNTDVNKLVIFSSIALYYGDNYIVSFPDPQQARMYRTEGLGMGLFMYMWVDCRFSMVTKYLY